MDFFVTLMPLIIFVILIIFCVNIFKKGHAVKKEKRSVESNSHIFLKYIESLDDGSSEDQIMSFFNFLHTFRGSNIKTHYYRQRLYIDRVDYAAEDREQLKYFFFNSLVPNPNISIEIKEQFRDYLGKTLGIYGLEKKPQYLLSKPAKQNGMVKNHNKEGFDPSAENSELLKIRSFYETVKKYYDQKDYHGVISSSRTLLDIMVKYMISEFNIESMDLKSNIEWLCESSLINGTSRSNYHRIREVGNEAIHDASAAEESAEEIFRLINKEYKIFMLNNE